ncbi:MAG: hypothetical protein DLM50_06145 [Candidatus Meridianibacter frigidus]|nr:MAG: hypothetical protein DLM50_06145 [Candidatus Eremiobacteraeota bacterium]
MEAYVTIVAVAPFFLRLLKLLTIVLTSALLALPVYAASSPEQTLGLIRHTFRSHRPPPPFVRYTLTRRQLTNEGFPDFIWTYTYHIWCRTSDNAALGRRVFRGGSYGSLEFLRPTFNAATDPGPPTADLFEPAPATKQATPAPIFDRLREIGGVEALGETDYQVLSAVTEGELIHVRLLPRREPERNRLRELFADRRTYELKKAVATDRLFTQFQSYPELYTLTLGAAGGYPVVTAIHGVVDDSTFDEAARYIDYTFTEISFPATMPDWYFEPSGYGAHAKEAPQ